MRPSVFAWRGGLIETSEKRDVVGVELEDQAVLMSEMTAVPAADRHDKRTYVQEFPNDANDTQVACRQWRVFAPLNLLLPLVLLQTVLAGCEVQPKIPADIEGSGFFRLCLLVVAVIFILLSVGGRIKIGKYISYELPEGSRTGRIFLAVLGVSILSFVGLQWIGFFQRDGVFSTESMEPEEPAESDEPAELLTSLTGRVSFGEYEDVFEKHYSELTVHVVAEGASSNVQRDGSFGINVSADTQMPVSITWRGDMGGEHVLWPMEIDSSADGFTMAKVEDIYVRQKNAAIDAVGSFEFERADNVLSELLAAERWFEPSWAYAVHRDLANRAEEYRMQPRYDWQFERKWRREAIRRATRLNDIIRAMNMWAGYSRVYQDWNEWEWTTTLPDVASEYLDALRADVELIVDRLAEESMGELVSNASRVITDCLNPGQREALSSFDSVLADPGGMNLNRMMNVISGLNRVVASRLGPWNYYSGEIEIVIEPAGDGFEYQLEINHPSNTERILVEFRPMEDASCRFIMGAESDPIRVYVVRESGFLSEERGGVIYSPIT